MNRSLDWLHQAQVDLAQAQLSADGGHGLGRSLRDLPPEASAFLAAAVPDLEDRLRWL